MTGINRRTFLQLGGMGLAAAAASPALGAGRTFDPSSARRRGQLGPVLGERAQTDVPTFVMVFLRGGADGLSQSIPLEQGEHDLYSLYRPSLAIDPGDIDSAGTRLLDGSGAETGWGLHPNMSALMPLWERGELLVMPDVHYDAASRSHFDSQQFYDNGTPGQPFTSEGWMNRFLQATPGNPLLRAIAFDTLPPFSLRGQFPAMTFTSLNDLSIGGSRNDAFLDAQEFAYGTSKTGPRAYDEPVGVGGEALIEAVRAIEQLKADPGLPATDPVAEAMYPSASPGNGQYAYFGNRLKDLASLIKSNAFEIQIAEVDLFGWDSHLDQLGSYYNITDLNETLARGLAAFWTDLGPTFQENVVICVMSEFGRTTRENGTAGTDHGSAMTSYVVGNAGKLQGRQVLHGPAGWYGLDDLKDNRDLKHSTDYRNVLLEIARQHLGASSPDIFPGFDENLMGFMS